MDLVRLNPVIRSAGLYEKAISGGERVGLDARVIYMVSGDISATVGGVKLGHLSPGHFLYIPAGVPYKLKSKYMRAVIMTFDLTDKDPLPEERIPPVSADNFTGDGVHADAFPPFDKFIRIEDMEEERDGFIRMANIFTSAEGSYRAQISAMLKLMLLKAAEVSDDNALPARMVEGLDSYIRENCSDEISNTEIGAVFGYHPFYISKLLKDKKGQTLRQYIIAYRLKLAKRMLELTDKSAVEIAEICGFTDASYFTKTFKSAFGCTPKEYRNGFKDEMI